MVTLNGQQKTAQTFRMSWLRLYAAITFWAVLLLAALLIVQMMLGGAFGPFHLFVVAANLLTGLLFGAVCAILITVFYPVRVGAQGIYSFNFWGVRGGMDWDEITSAKSLSFLGLPFLIVRSNQTKNALWLPLFFTDNAAFRQAIVQFAPPDSPLLPWD